MSAHGDLDRQIQSFLAEGPMELPDASYDEVRDRMEQKRQRAFIGPWRTPDVNRYLKVGLAAAAVVVIAVIGFQYLGGPNSGSPGATETPRPTATPTASAQPSAPADGSLPVGSSFVLWDATQGGATPELGIKIVVTIPAAGWFGTPGEGVLKKNDNADAPDGAGLTVFARTNDLLVGLGDVYVYRDPCHWATTTPDTPVTTIDEAIAALSAQPSRDASTPVDVTYDGYAGKYITLHVPDDAVFSDCDQGEFRTLGENDGDDSARSHEDPGQFDLFTVLDVNGELVIFDLAFFEGAEGTPGSVLDEMAGILTSATLEYVD
jgi:hypothetical protein